MARSDMSDLEWEFIKAVLPNKSRGMKRVDDRRVINGIFYVLRTGIPWADLPEQYGPPTTVYNRFNRWSYAGHWDRIMEAVADAHNVDTVMVDGTSIRAHHAATTLEKNDTRRCPGRSRGGLGTKIHALTNQDGLPIRFELTPGEAHDAPPCKCLLDALQPGQYVLADKACDAHWIREMIWEQGAIAVIPSRSNRKLPREFDAEIYKERNKRDPSLTPPHARRTAALLKSYGQRAFRYLASTRSLPMPTLGLGVDRSNTLDIFALRMDAALQKPYKTTIKEDRGSSGESNLSDDINDDDPNGNAGGDVNGEYDAAVGGSGGGSGRSDDPAEGPAKPVYDGPMISIEDEMKRSYLDYAMSVIVSRAIPDARDGLKPVHRRILYAMHETNNTHDKAYRKSARPVGDVMGKYHPHGDSAIYDALVRMAQDFSMRLPLLDGQGNFGSMDGDNPAAMRYTEVRMDKPASSLLADIEKDTVDFQDNYDGKDREPSVLPARFPNMLVNGAGGIAVGMATNIPPHNLGEVIDATLALIDNPDLTAHDLIEYVPAPDFPTGAMILGRAGARKAYTEGRGSVIIRAKTHVEEIRKDRYAIVVDEIPYQVNKLTMIQKIGELVREKKIDGLHHVQDESDRHGVRVVIELKRDATPEVVLNQLFRFTPLQTYFGCNMLALNNGKPEQMDLHGFLKAFVDFREDVVTRRTAFELRKARERSHVLCGLAVAVENVDEIVATIRASADAAEARAKLMDRRWPAVDIASYIMLIDDPSHKMNEDGTYYLSEAQARAILELRLQRLTAIGVKEVTDELEELAVKIKDYLDILRSRERVMAIISAELMEVRENFATPRRSEIVDFIGDMDDEDLIEREDMVVTVTHGGYIKRTPLADYRAQARGGKGLSGMSTKDDDFITTLFVANTHTPILFFTTDGIVYKLKTWRLPLGSRTTKGKAVVNVLPVQPGVSIAAVMPVDAAEEDWDKLQIMFATSKGGARRNALSDFTNVKANGKIAMKFEGDDENATLVDARICKEDDDVMLVTAKGKAIRFPTTDVRVFQSRASTGVRGIRLAEDDEVVSMSIIRHFKASPEERAAYIKMRRAVAGQTDEETTDEDIVADIALTNERYVEMSAAENLILTITENGAGKLSSSHDYPVRGRGGQGVGAMDKAMRGGRLVASFPVEIDDQIMLVTDGGQSIRCPVGGISFRSRGAGGVKVFNTGKDEKVVSVAWIAEQSDEAEDPVAESGSDES